MVESREQLAREPRKSRPPPRPPARTFGSQHTPLTGFPLPVMFRSQSGPSALSINTASANSLSTPSSLPPPGGGKSLFGSTATAPAQPQTSGLFGSSVTTSQPQSTSSLFGNTQAQVGNTQSQQTGGLFGSQSTNKSQEGGLFGSATNNTQNPGGGLFGSQQPQQTANTLFGNTQQNQPQTIGGPFGSTFGQTQTQQPRGSLFGSHNLSNPSVLNNQVPSQNQQSTMQASAQPSLFSATIGQHAQQANIVPGVRISVNELRPTTRFNDLHEELQKAIEYVDGFILEKIQWRDACDSEGGQIETMCQQLPPDVEYCTKQLETMQQALENDAESIDVAKNLVRADAADAKLSFKVVQNLRLPPQFHQTSLWSTAMAPQKPRAGVVEEGFEDGESRNLVEYFSKQTETMSKTLDSYKQNIAEVEEYLQGMESNTMQQMQQIMSTRGPHGNRESAEDQVRELASVLRAFENGILGVAAKVGGTRESLQDVMLGTGSQTGGRYRGP